MTEKLLTGTLSLNTNKQIYFLNPSHAAIKISINATAAGFICKNIFPTPVQVKKIIKNKIGDIQQKYYTGQILHGLNCWEQNIYNLHGWELGVTNKTGS